MSTEIAPTTLGLAGRGDTMALARIVAAYQDDMTRICYVICGDADLAQDAVQAAWLVACRKLHTVRDPERLRPWLMAVAVNEARQMIRRRQRTVVVDLALVGDIPATGADPASRAGLVDLEGALRRLSLDDRALLAMRYAVDLDATEIGRALGMSASGVRSRLSRLVSRLRTELDHDR